MTTRAEVEEIAKHAAREAVREWLVTLGIDASDPAAVVEVQKDFAHTRAWRKSVETVRGTAIKAGVTVAVSGFLGALWLMIRPGH